MERRKKNGSRGDNRKETKERKTKRIVGGKTKRRENKIANTPDYHNKEFRTKKLTKQHRRSHKQKNTDKLSKTPTTLKTAQTLSLLSPISHT